MYKKRQLELVFYITTLFVISLIWWIVLRVWEADWHIPFDYGTELGTDVLGSSIWLKTYIQNGFSWKQADFSVPFYTDRKIFFGIDWIILLLEIVCSHIFSSYGACLNTLYLLSFLTTGLAAAYSLRCLQFSRGISLTGAIMYTFLQYHMMRGEMHLYLSFYYSAPLAVLIMLWIVNESLLAERFSQYRIGRLKHAHILFIFFSWIIGLQQPYYAFYSAIGIAFALLYSLCHKQYLKSAESTIYLTIIAITTLAGNVNALLYTSDTAMEYMRQQRTVDAIEAYGLKIINLVLPVQNHRLPVLAELRQHYDSLVGTISSREESWISLGVILSICFCIAIATVLVDGKSEKRIRLCGCFILLLVLVSTVGGASSAIGLIFSLLRCYNRMVVYIAMFCIIVFAVLAEKAKTFFSAKKVAGSVQYIMLILLTVFAVWDQTTQANVYDYEAVKKEYMQDAEFVHAIETIMPEGAHIFELPILPTGVTAIHELRDYELYKPYLHASSTKWLHMYSVGSMTDQWVNILHSLPLRTIIDIVVCCNFQGIYIDSRGYAPDEWDELLAVMNSIEGATSIYSKDGQKVFYSLTNYSAALTQQLGPKRMKQYADFWLSCPNLTIFSASSLLYTKEINLYGDGILLSPGCVQYGPYITIQPGDYIVYLIGENLNSLEFDLSYANGTIQLPIHFLDKENNLVKYTFRVDAEISGAEMRSLNKTNENSVIKGILLFNANQSDEIFVLEDFLHINQQK